MPERKRCEVVLYGFYLNLIFIFGFSFQRIFRIEIFSVNLHLFGTFNFIFEPKTSYDIKVFMSTRIMPPPTLSSKVDRRRRPRRPCEPAREGWDSMYCL